MADRKSQGSDKLQEKIEASYAKILEEVPRSLREAAERSRSARAEHTRRVENTRDWIRNGARPLKGRYRP